MTTYNVAKSKHATLGVATVDRVLLSNTSALVRIRNRHTTDALYFVVNGSADPVDPTVAGDDSHFLGAGENIVIELTGPVSTVELIAATAVPYSVEIF